MKICNDCGVEKESEAFNKNKAKTDGLFNICKDCETEKRITRSRTKSGLLSIAHNSQKQQAKKLNRPLPKYDKETFIQHFINNVEFLKMYDIWVEQEYDKKHTPMIRMLNSEHGYVLSNFETSSLTDIKTGKAKQKYEGTTKICKTCCAEKQRSEFGDNPPAKDGLRDSCKSCRTIEKETYKRSLSGFIVSAYSLIKTANTNKNEETILTQIEFKNWLLNSNTFIELFAEWNNSDFKKELKPSIRKLDFSKPHTLANLYITSKQRIDDERGENCYVKKCTRCKKVKLLEDFPNHRTHRKGVGNHCSDCKAIHRKTISHLLTDIYGHQKDHSISRGHPAPEYSKSEFETWMYENKYAEIYKKWEDSDFNKDLIPSVDRKDSTKPYTIENIQLVTWEENKNNWYEEVETVCNLAVIKCNLDGETLKVYNSINKAAKDNNINSTAIKKCCYGNSIESGGFMWKFLSHKKHLEYFTGNKNECREI